MDDDVAVVDDTLTYWCLEAVDYRYSLVTKWWYLLLLVHGSFHTGFYRVRMIAVPRPTYVGALLVPSHAQDGDAVTHEARRAHPKPLHHHLDHTPSLAPPHATRPVMYRTYQVCKSQTEQPAAASTTPAAAHRPKVKTRIKKKQLPLPRRRSPILDILHGMLRRNHVGGRG